METKGYEPMKRVRYLLVLPKMFGEVDYFVKPSEIIHEGDIAKEINLEIVRIVGNGENKMLKIVQNIAEGYIDSPILEFKLHSVDPTGVFVETWSIIGEMVSFSFGELSFSDNEDDTIGLTITFKTHSGLTDKK